MTKHCYFCPKCQVYHASNHSDPEKVFGICPCGKTMMLHHGQTLEELKKELYLGKSEIGVGEITYRVVSNTY